MIEKERIKGGGKEDECNGWEQYRKMYLEIEIGKLTFQKASLAPTIVLC